jgi:ferredoxin
VPDTAESVGNVARRSRRRRDPEEEVCQRLLSIALRQAGRCGLCGECAEDCALGFVAHLIPRVRGSDAARVTDA